MKSHKVLFIDPVCPIGHINFNSIHIKSLINQGFDVDVVFESRYIDNFPQFKSNLTYEYPKLSYRNNSIVNRLRQRANFKNILKNVSLDEYEAVIISYYDEITLSLIHFKKPLYLINHNNVAGIIRSNVKRFFYKLISRKNVQIVFDRNSFRELQKMSIPSIKLVNHGFIHPFISDPDWSFTKIGINGQYKKIVFSPSAGSVDKNLIEKLIYSSDFRNTLNRFNTLFILRWDRELPGITLSDNILIIKNRLSITDYQNIFLRSDIILISYPDTFMFRTSGVLMEAFANNKTVLLPRTSNFLEYKDYLEYESYYYSKNEFIDHLSKYLEKSSDDCNVHNYANLSEPDYSFLNDAIYQEL